MRAPAAAFCLLLVPLLLPLAGADHVYSHRYVVLGRVLDGAGDPVAGATVEVAWPSQVEACHPYAGGATDAWPEELSAVATARGEFAACLHAHNLMDVPPGTRAFARALAPDGAVLAETSFEIDARIRVTAVTLRAAPAEAQANLTDHVVAGRLFAPWVPGVPLDGVPVVGQALAHRDVRILASWQTLDGAQREVQIDTATSAYGDFAVRLELGGKLRLGGATVIVDGEEVATASLDADAGLTHLKIERPPEARFTLVSASGDGRFVWRAAGFAAPNPTLPVLPGSRVTIEVVNGDDIPHNLMVGDEEASEIVVEKGERLLYNFTMPEEGLLRYVCPIHGAAMSGTLVATTDWPPKGGSEEPDVVVALGVLVHPARGGFAFAREGRLVESLVVAPGKVLNLSLVPGDAPHGLEARPIGAASPIASGAQPLSIQFEMPNATVEVRCPVHPATMVLFVTPEARQGSDDPAATPAATGTNATGGARAPGPGLALAALALVGAAALRRAMAKP